MSSPNADKAVILARGLGTRMRKTAQTSLTDSQAAVADTGIKALIPIDRPFLDYVMSALADAGWRRICLVIGPEHTVLRDYYTKVARRRVTIDFAIQEKPLGTANAVAAAEEFAAGEPFLCINSDNYYPVDAITGLRQLDGLGLVGYERDAMIAGSNIPPERISRFAVIRIADGKMVRIMEKPDPRELEALPRPFYVSMNCWRFESPIFDACRAIKPSPRGEYEVTDAVQHVIDNMGGQFSVIKSTSPVLDLSCREDIESVAKRLRSVKVSL